MQQEQLPQRNRHYLGPAYDSARWDHFRPRPGDIIVVTPNKCGTTWTQMLCALLVHQSPTLPQPLTRLSRWLDRHTDPIDGLIDEFEKQDFRRVVKTHTPLDGLPWFTECAYVFCGRDPRDAFLSMADHMQNLSEKTRIDARRRMGVPDDAPEMLELFADLDAAFTRWLTVGEQPWLRDGFPSGSVLDMSATYWAWRHLPNLHFLHYADLVANLDGEMRRLSAFLGIPVDEARWPSLVAAGRFEAMKAGAAENAPGAHHEEWKSPEAFFRAGRLGAWRDALGSESLALYERVMAERYEPEFRRWLEGGRIGSGLTPGAG
jgi:aryl sulfotransferase